MGLRVAFATCVQLGLSCIKEIYRIGGETALLITLDDRLARAKSGRVYLDQISEQHQVPLLKVSNINEARVIDAVRQSNIDWLFIVGWSQIAGSELLAAPKIGCIGMHPSLLPEGRGRAAIPWAILKGLKCTGVTMFKLDAGIDTGDIIGQKVIGLRPQETATELYSYVADAHVQLIAEYWNDIEKGSVVLTKQNDDEASEWPARKPEDGEIFAFMSMAEAERLVRAVTHPYPGAFFWEDGKRVRVWTATVDRNRGRFPLSDGYLTPVEFEVEEHE